MKQVSQILIKVKAGMVDRGTLTPGARQQMNAVIQERLVVETRQRESAIACRQAAYKCEQVGHIDHIANGYQSLWDNGVDCPVQCARCGRVEM